MRLILIGCEYSGGSTMARAIAEWLLRERAATAVRIHDHWVYPYIADQDPSTCFIVGPDGIVPEEWRYGHLGYDAALSEEWADDVRALKPWLLEQLQRIMVWRHMHHTVIEGGRVGQHPGRPSLRGGGLRAAVLRVRPGQLLRPPPPGAAVGQGAPGVRAGDDPGAAQGVSRGDTGADARGTAAGRSPQGRGHREGDRPVRGAVCQHGTDAEAGHPHERRNGGGVGRRVCEQGRAVPHRRRPPSAGVGSGPRPRAGEPGWTGVSPKIDATCCFLWDLIVGGSDSINRLATHSQRRPGRTAMFPRRHCNRESPMPAAAEGAANDTIQPKPPALWIPAFAGMTVCKGLVKGEGTRRGRERFLRKLFQIAPDLLRSALGGTSGGTGLILIQRTIEADPDGGGARMDAVSGCGFGAGFEAECVGGHHARHYTNGRSSCQEAGGIAALAQGASALRFRGGSFPGLTELDRSRTFIRQTQ